MVWQAPPAPPAGASCATKRSDSSFVNSAGKYSSAQSQYCIDCPPGRGHLVFIACFASSLELALQANTRRAAIRRPALCAPAAPRKARPVRLAASPACRVASQASRVRSTVKTARLARMPTPTTPHLASRAGLFLCLSILVRRSVEYAVPVRISRLRDRSRACPRRSASSRASPARSACSTAVRSRHRVITVAVSHTRWL